MRASAPKAMSPDKSLGRSDGQAPLIHFDRRASAPFPQQIRNVAKPWRRRAAEGEVLRKGAIDEDPDSWALAALVAISVAAFSRRVPTSPSRSVRPARADRADSAWPRDQELAGRRDPPAPDHQACGRQRSLRSGRSSAARPTTSAPPSRPSPRMSANGAIVLPLLNGMRHHDDLRDQLRPGTAASAASPRSKPRSRPAARSSTRASSRAWFSARSSDYPPTLRVQQVISDFARIAETCQLSLSKLLDPGRPGAVGQMGDDRDARRYHLTLMRGAAGDVMAASEGARTRSRSCCRRQSRSPPKTAIRPAPIISSMRESC